MYVASKIKNTSPKGIIAVTVTQDRFDKNKDYVNLETGEMYADYYSSSITPEEVLPDVEGSTSSTTNTDILTIEAKTYSVRINGGSKVVYAKVLDGDGNDVTNKYNSDDLIWSFKFKDIETVNTLISIDEAYSMKSGNEYKKKFKFLGDEQYLNKRITVDVKLKDLSASAELDIVS